MDVKERMFALLRRIEWSSEWCGIDYCPCCEGNKDEGHRGGCELNLMVKELEKPEK